MFGVSKSDVNSEKEYVLLKSSAGIDKPTVNQTERITEAEAIDVVTLGETL
jgi:hypothetical protein